MALVVCYILDILSIINLTILECKSPSVGLGSEVVKYNKSNHIGM